MTSAAPPEEFWDGSQRRRGRVGATIMVAVTIPHGRCGGRREARSHCEGARRAARLTGGIEVEGALEMVNPT